METLKLIGVICISILLTSCANMQLYEGDKQAPESVVVIKGMCVWNKASVFGSDEWIEIRKFDGKAIKNCQLTYEFLPGKHTLTLFSGDEYQSTVTKEFTAGERYKLGKDVYFPALIYMGKYNNETGNIEP